jgi:hypothetical protein
MEAASRAWVIDAMVGLADPDDVFQQGTGGVQVALVAQDDGEVVAAVGGVGVVGAQVGLENAQGALVSGTGGVEGALVV